MKLYASGEDYLEAVLVLHKKNGYGALRGRGPASWSIQAQRCHAVAVLQEGGFLLWMKITSPSDRTGAQDRRKNLRAASFFYRMLMEAGVDLKIAEKDACRIEHLVQR